MGLDVMKASRIYLLCAAIGGTASAIDMLLEFETPKPENYLWTVSGAFIGGALAYGLLLFGAFQLGALAVTFVRDRLKR